MDQNLVDPCSHGRVLGLCKDCLVEGFVEKKTKTPLKSFKHRSQDQERRITKAYKKAGFTNARKQLMSGSLPSFPADVDPGELFLVEAKETSQGSLVIDPDWLLKVRKESMGMGRKGWYALHAWVSRKDVHRYYKVVVVEEELWYHIMEHYKNEVRS